MALIIFSSILHDAELFMHSKYFLLVGIRESADLIGCWLVATLIAVVNPANKMAIYLRTLINPKH